MARGRPPGPDGLGSWPSLQGKRVLVTGAGTTGRSVARFLVAQGADALVAEDRQAPGGAGWAMPVPVLHGLTTPPAGIDLIVTSPGWRPTTPLFVAAAAAGIPVVGDIELAWWADSRPGAAARPWIGVTGTNGKTTTIGMVEAILRAAGRVAVASGNVGLGVLDVVTADPSHDVVAVELSSFQLHYAPSVRLAAGVVLNVAEDHLDWHGSMTAYAAAKAQALTGEVAVAVVDDPGAAALLASSSAPRKVAVTGADPGPGALGVRSGMLFDAAFGAGALLPVTEVRPAGAHNITNALAAAAVTLAIGITGADVAAGLRDFIPGGHRNTPVAEVAGVRYVDDSKATNPHAALASLADYPNVVWVAGGQLKGASVDELVQVVASRLRGVVLLGVDRELIAAAMARHAPDVPVRIVTDTDDGAMTTVVAAAASMAAPGDVVLLAPAAASLDMFASYAARGDAFADAVAQLASAVPAADGSDWSAAR